MADNNQGRGGNQGGKSNSQSNHGGNQSSSSNRGFASMDPEEQREIASEGGREAHRQGVAHEWDSEEAAEAGRKGGQARSGGNEENEGGGSTQGGNQTGGRGGNR